MSTDPLWEKYLGWNAYQYSGNNPVSFLDGNGYFHLDAKGELLIKKHNGETYLTTYTGTKIYVDVGNATNCAGWALAMSQDGIPQNIDIYDSRKIAIEPSSVESVIREDGFGEEFTDKTKVKNGDYIIFYDGNNKIQHVGMVTDVSMKNNNVDILRTYTDNSLQYNREEAKRTNTENIKDFKTLSRYHFLYRFTFVLRIMEPKKTNEKSYDHQD